MTNTSWKKLILIAGFWKFFNFFLTFQFLPTADLKIVTFLTDFFRYNTIVMKNNWYLIDFGFFNKSDIVNWHE